GAAVHGGRARAGAAAEHERPGPGVLPDAVLHPVDRPGYRLVDDLRLDLPAVVRHRELAAVGRARQRPGLVLLDQLVQTLVHPARPVGPGPADGDLPGRASGRTAGNVRGRRPGGRERLAAAAQGDDPDDQPGDLVQRDHVAGPVHPVL